MGSVTGAKLAKAPSPVLCVDLDGTLIPGNLLWECVLALLTTHPLTLFLFPLWLLSGRAEHFGEPGFEYGGDSASDLVPCWLSRNWLLAHCGELKEAPVTPAIRDRVSYGVAFPSSIVIAASMLHMSF